MISSYKDIDEYGLIGNLETCALVGRDGSIDWLCFPYIESPSVVACILDNMRGGRFRVAPRCKFDSIQSYRAGTNILETTFTTFSGEVVITDFMPVKGVKSRYPWRMLLRKVHGMRGEVPLSIDFSPRMDYGRKLPEFVPMENGVTARWRDQTLYLQAPAHVHVANTEATGEFVVREGNTYWFVLQYNHRLPLSDGECEDIEAQVETYWLAWAHKCGDICSFTGRWHDLAVRSGLALKLLSNPENGAIAAAATTSLPEAPGGLRNWDYRYAWIRDVSFTVQALYHLGHMVEARQFLAWIQSVVKRQEKPYKLNMQVFYSLHGEADLSEKILDHLEGHRSSSPVRIGNSAVNQVQLDIYGELLSAIYDITRYGHELSDDVWPVVRDIVNHVSQSWGAKDSGIWEMRTRQRHFVHSKLMCWVALDRGIRIAEAKGFPAPVEEWQRTRSEIRNAILTHGFNERLNSFVQSFGSEYLDSATLHIVLQEFLPASDPRVQGTINSLKNRLMTTNGLMYRYEGEDGLPGREGAFFICSFWMVKALALSDRVEEADELFEKIIDYVSPLGLMAEEVDPETGVQLGNFPQAFSHIGLLNSVIYLAISKGKKFHRPQPMGVVL